MEKNTELKIDSRAAELIKEAEMILVGIGKEFSPVCPDFSGDPTLAPYMRSKFYEELPADHESICAYNKLRELIGPKPYFVVTLNTDDLIWRSAFEKDLIVAPCGSMGKMQCEEHIVEAAPIRDAVLAGNPAAAVCPVCGAPLQFHTIEQEGYLESGYLPQWEKYTKWLSCTLNRRLVLLELGTDFQFPQVIRWPFEKVATYNKKASLVRVGSRFPQLPEHLSECGISIAQSPIQFLLNE